MPWKLIGFAVIFGILVAFITFNLGNTCDINYGPFESAKIADVPVFLTVFVCYFAGLFTAIPFIISAGRKRRKAVNAEEGEKSGKLFGNKKENQDKSPDVPPANAEE